MMRSVRWWVVWWGILAVSFVAAGARQDHHHGVTTTKNETSKNRTLLHFTFFMTFSVLLLITLIAFRPQVVERATGFA